MRVIAVPVKSLSRAKRRLSPLLCPLERAVPGRSGPDPFRKHVEGETRRGLPASVVEAPGLPFDLDTPADVARVLAADSRGGTAQGCREMGLGARLRVPS